MKYLLSDIAQRFYTSILLIGSGIFLVFYSHPRTFLFLTSILFTLASWEWTYLNGYRSLKTRSILVGLLWVGVMMIQKISLEKIFIIAYLLEFILISYIIWLIFQKNLPKLSNYFSMSLGSAMFLLTARSVVYLKTVPSVLGISLLIIALTDTLAYIMGSLWGHSLLNAKLSPKKTWRGFWSAMIIPTLFIMLVAEYPISMIHRIVIGLMVITISMAALAGDLLESFLKRKQGLKDSGSLLPGHGGILDRFDSFMTAIPVASAHHYFLYLLIKKNIIH